MHDVVSILNRYIKTSASPVTITAAVALLKRYKAGETGAPFVGDLLELSAAYCNEKDKGGNYSAVSIVEALLDEFVNFGD